MTFFQSPHPGRFNRARAKEAGREQWGPDFRDCNEHEDPATGQLSVRTYFEDGAPVTQIDADAFVAAHNPDVLSEGQQIIQDALAAEDPIREVWDPTLRDLNIRARLFVLWGRRLQQIRGDAITIQTVPEVGAYWDGEMSAAGTEAGRLKVQRDSFQATLELLSSSIARFTG